MAAEPRPTGERIAVLSAEIDDLRNRTIGLRADLAGSEGDAVRIVAVMLAEAVDVLNEVLEKRRNAAGGTT